MRDTDDAKGATADDLLALAVLVDQRSSGVGATLLIGSQLIPLGFELVDPGGHKRQLLLIHLVVSLFPATQHIAQQVGQLFLPPGASQIMRMVAESFWENLEALVRRRGTIFLLIVRFLLIRLVDGFTLQRRVS